MFWTNGRLNRRGWRQCPWSLSSYKPCSSPNGFINSLLQLSHQLCHLRTLTSANDAKTNLDMKSIRNSQLSVPYGYHSLAMAPVIDDLRVLSRKIKTQAPSLPVISTVLGRVILPGDISSFNNDLFCSTLRRTCQINSRDLFIHFERGFVFPSNDMDRTWSASTHFTHATKVSRSLRFSFP